MKSNINSIIRISLIPVLMSVSLFTQLSMGQKTRKATGMLDLNGNGREELINVYESSGKMFADMLSLNGKGFYLKTVLYPRHSYMFTGLISG